VIRRIIPLLALSCTMLAGSAEATNVPALTRLAAEFAARLEAARGPAYEQLLRQDRGAFVNGPLEETQLIFVDPRGMPRYFLTDNETAAQTISTDEVHPGGSTGRNLTGSTMTAGDLAVWDGGAVRTSHVELSGRTSQEDGASSYSNHSTHVSGTLIGEGDDPSALGMSYEGELHCYDWNSDTSEQATAAAQGMLISNHSYGYTTGWRFNSGDGEWYWYGDLGVSTDEDYGFGYYDSNARDWDQIAFDAPNYLICASAGNDRNDFGPGPGGSHYHWDGNWTLATDTHDPDGGTTGYDTVAWLKNAKNIMAVGAIEDIPGGWTQTSDVVMSTFSGWGPTDDGRIKPDLCANGVGLWSSTATSNTSYSSYSGTSMASPNAAGSTNLVIQHWKTTQASPARSATIKAILFNTTDEAGNPGPDYSFGWGLLNTASAVQLVQSHSTLDPGFGRVFQSTLSDGGEDVLYLTGLGGPVKITLAWTDPAGTPPPGSLDPPDAMLVNDLDLRVTGPGATTYEPWVLDPANPSTSAAIGDNFRDNAEQVYVANLPSGAYEVRVSHKSTLQGGSQAYSIASSEPLAVQQPATAAPEVAAAAVEHRISPNPFRAATAITYSLPAPSEVTLTIHDVTGRLVRTLESGRLPAGAHRHDWDARDESGRTVPAGVYFSRLTANGQTRSEKIVRLTR